MLQNNVREQYKYSLSYILNNTIVTKCIFVVKALALGKTKLKQVLFCFSTRLHYSTYGEDKLHSGKQN